MSSSLPGGPADKAGNVYEALWGVHGMVKVIGGQASSIRIEEPGTHGAEFYLESRRGCEHWQAKRQILSQNTWSLNLLKKEGILDFFWGRINSQESCVFASISDAPELRILAERAQNAQDFDEFQRAFLATASWNQHFNDLKSHLNCQDSNDAFRFLLKIRVETASETTIEGLILPVFRATFNESPETVLSLLRDYYLQSVHKNLNAEAILKHLGSHNIHARTLNISAETHDLLNGVSATYIAGQKANLIRRESIPRQAALDIVERVKMSDKALDILIASPAGGGKSAALMQIATELGVAGIPVFAFRLDRIEPVASTQALGNKLNLPDSPPIVLAQCYPGQTVALIIDQLDFVSATSGRHPDFFEVVAALAEEVRGLRSSCNMHLIMACREFDFNNDSRIKQLLPANEVPVTLGPLSDMEVRNAIVSDGGTPATLSTKQITLLTLPQNLSLFIESGLSKEQAPTFVTQKELLDLYWDAKRLAVSRRCPEHSPDWIDVTTKLSNEMSAREELSVPKSRLDEFSPELLNAMTSEGVLSFDGQRYGFSHESLFDYCFARSEAASGRDFIEFLEGDPQELFRRSQLRQVLAYLREDDLSRYLRYLERIICSATIRSHLKLLTMELVSSFPNPRDDEFQILLPYLEAELNCRKNGVINPNKIESRVWDTFLFSSTLFLVAHRLGNLEKWLQSGNEQIEDTIIGYLRVQMDKHGDRIAELLEPFVGRSDLWKARLRFVMERVHRAEGEKLFSLFLRLLEDGTLDDARDRFVSNETFWSMLHGLDKTRPIWCARVAAQWLDRKVVLAKKASAEGNKCTPKLNDDSGVNILFSIAKVAPEEILEFVLPSVLRASESFIYEDQEGLLRDGIWPTRFSNDWPGLAEAFLNSCETAIEQSGAKNASDLIPLIASLRESPLYIANHFLFTAYLTAPEMFAEQAISLLADEPERFYCGNSENVFWVTRTLIEKCSPHCSGESFQKLEKAILEFTTLYEQTPEGEKCAGNGAYNLAASLPKHRWSVAMEEQFSQWAEKFGEPSGPPRGFRSYNVVSPISNDIAENMTDEQWLAAIAKYNNTQRMFDWDHPELGGAAELAGMFQEFVKKDPNRFGRLALSFSQDTNPSYFMNVLYGLKTDTADSMLKIDVVRRVFESTETACLMAALDLLTTVTGIYLPEDTVDFIKKMATEHPHPEPSGSKEEDLLSIGINSVRGHAVEAIRSLIFHDKFYVDIFETTIEHSVHDASLAVRACAASMLSALAIHDSAKAIALFKNLLIGGDALLASPYVERFLAHGLQQHPAELRPIIERMIGANKEKARESGGTLAALARLYHPSLDDLAEMAMAGDPACRLGVAEVAGQNLAHRSCRDWCEATLIRLFQDEDAQVRQKAAHCFWLLWQYPDLPLSEHDRLICSFLGSQSFSEEPTFLLHALEETRKRVPETILDVCEVFVEKCSQAARDIRTSIAGDEMTVGKLVFRAYAQFEALTLRKRALNLIDAMCLEGLQSAGTHLKEFDR